MMSTTHKDKSSIPLRIHQIWFQGRDAIPEKYRVFTETWKKEQQEFIHEFWDQPRIELLMREYPDYEKTYTSFSTMIQKIDFAKYVILFHYGGIYIDMDVFSVKKLSPFMDKHSDLDFICFQHNTPCITITVNKFMGLDGAKIINNAVIFSTARNVVIKNVIEACVEAQNNWRKNWVSVQLRCLITTGPIVFTNCIRKQQNWKKYLFPAYIFEPFTTLDMVKMSSEYTTIKDGFFDYFIMMEFLKTHNPAVSSTVGIHVLDLNWFKNGKNNWKFRAFKQMQKIPVRYKGNKKGLTIVDLPQVHQQHQQQQIAI